MADSSDGAGGSAEALTVAFLDLPERENIGGLHLHVQMCHH